MKRTLEEVYNDQENSIHDSDNGSEESENESEQTDETETDVVLKQLSPNIPEDKASEFLHTLASSKAILYWNRYGEMTYHERRIPLTEMVELIDYAMLPYNPDVRNPRGLQTFIKGLLELGINKSLIKNKKMLVEMIARQSKVETNSDDSDFSSAEQDGEIHSDDNDNDDTDDDDDDSHDGDVSLDDDDDADSNGQEDENASESDEDEEEGNCHACQEIKTFRRIPLIVCPFCQWEDQTWFPSWGTPVLCDICKTVIPTDSTTVKKLFCQCKDCGAIHQHNWKRNDHKLIQ